MNECTLIDVVLGLPFVRPSKRDIKGHGLVGTSENREENHGLPTLMTSTPRSSASLHVLPTENEPLVFSLDLCMKPEPSEAPGVRQSDRVEGMMLWTHWIRGCSEVSSPGSRRRPPIS